MNDNKDGIFGVDSDGVMTVVTTPVGAGYGPKQWKKVNIREGARQVKKRLQPKGEVDAFAEAWLRFMLWKAGNSSAETGIGIVAGWAASRLKPERFGELRDGLWQEHQPLSAEEALLTELLGRVSDLDASILNDPKFLRLPFDLANQIQSELRRSHKQVLESDHQPLEDGNVWAIENVLASKELDPEEALLSKESEVAEFAEAAGLGPQEHELMQAILNNPSLSQYGGNKELAEILDWSAEQVGVVKKRAYDKMRRVGKNYFAA